MCLYSVIILYCVIFYFSKLYSFWTLHPRAIYRLEFSRQRDAIIESWKPFALEPKPPITMAMRICREL